MSVATAKPRPRQATRDNDPPRTEEALPNPKPMRKDDHETEDESSTEQQTKTEQKGLEEATEEDPFSLIQRLVLPDNGPSTRKQKPAPTAPKDPLADDPASPANDTKPPPIPSDLSELAQQLRLLQSRGDAQALEIQRLERQLQVLADLQGVSVRELREALRAACAAQAAPELRATLADLRNQLQAAQLQLALRAAPAEGPRRSEVADLQLLIGELEELEQQQSKEIQVLYNDLKEQSSSWIRLKAKYEEQEQLLEEYRQRERHRESLKQPGKANDRDDVDYNDSADENDDGMHDEEERLESSEQMLREELELAFNLSGLFGASAQGAITPQTVEQKVEERQLAIMQQQFEEAEKSYKLKNAQLKARNFVLEECVQDLEQQLSSLYTAFNLTAQDLDQEQQVRRALELNLNEADQQVAQYIDTASQKETAVALTRPATTTFLTNPYSPEQAPLQGAMNMRPYPPMMTNFQTVESPSRRLSSTSLTDSSSPRASFSPNRTMRSMHSGECILEGILLFRTAGLRRKLWKEKHAALYISSSQFYLVLSNLGDHSNAKTYVSPIGSSELRLYHKQPFAFTLLVSSGEPFATVLYLAAIDETDFDNWMNALGAVSTNSGRESEVDTGYTGSGRETTSNYFEDIEDREAADLERAILLSTEEQANSNEFT